MARRDINQSGPGLPPKQKSEAPEAQGAIPADIWSPKLDPSAGPLYLAIANAIAADITSGTLRPGMRLPPQRTLAARLGVDFTTITRAYAEARRQGLVAGKVGHGTWISDALPPRPTQLDGGTAADSVGLRRPRAELPNLASAPLARPRQPERNGLIDMSMNLPPPVGDSGLSARMWDSIARIGRDGGADLLMRYQEPGGARHDREAGADWLAHRIPGIDADHVLACPGAQSAMLAAFSALCSPGDAICAADLVYPGLTSIAAVLGLRILPVARDDDGLVAESLDEICTAHAPRVLYCNPSLNSPTTQTMSLERRRLLIAVARRHRLTIMEDDAYGALASNAPPPLAQLAPDIVYYIAGMAKCLAPALRVAWLVAPGIGAATRLAASISATTLMASPLTVAIATNWIRTGIADMVRDAIRDETSARVALARSLLPAELLTSDPDAFHLWLQAPQSWTGMELAARLRAAGVAAVPAESFAINAAPQALRLGLGVPATRGDLERNLHITADLLSREPGFRPGIV